MGALILRALVTTLLVALAPSPWLTAVAQWTPSQPVEIVVMAGPGGGADRATRELIDIIARNALAEVTFEPRNVAGNSGADALQLLQQRAGTDHTLLFTLNSFYTVPIDRPELGLDTTTFAPIARMAEDAFMLWVHRDRRDIRTLDDFIRAARAKGSGWVMVGTGRNTEDNLLTDFINATFGLTISYRAFGGGGEVAQELAERRADSTVNNPAEQAEQLAAGHTKPIMAFSPKRLAVHPRIPTLREHGVAFQYHMQRSFAGPPGMSEAARAYFQRLFKAAFATADWQAYRQRNSLEGEFLAGPELAAYWAREQQRHVRLQRNT